MSIHSAISGATAGLAWAHRPFTVPNAVRRHWDALPAPELRRQARRLIRVTGTPAFTAPTTAYLVAPLRSVTPRLLHRAVRACQAPLVAAWVGAYGALHRCPESQQNPQAAACDPALVLYRARGSAERAAQWSGQFVDVYLTTVAICVLLGATLGLLSSAAAGRRRAQTQTQA